MKINIKIKSDFLRELKVDLKWSDIEKDYTATYNKLRSNYQIKGFIFLNWFFKFRILSLIFFCE